MSDVYEPREDSLLFLRWLKEKAKGRVLDMGTGSGVLALEAARHAEHVTAADINPSAVKAAEQAAAKAKLTNITVLESDLFSNIPKQQFDLIVFNPPYLPNEPGTEDAALDGGRKGHELLIRFLNEAVPYLAAEGEMLILFSTLTGKRRIEEEVARLALVMQIKEEKKLWFESLHLANIWRSPLRKRLESQGYRDITLEARGKRGMVYSALEGKGKKAQKVLCRPSDCWSSLQ